MKSILERTVKCFCCLAKRKKEEYFLQDKKKSRTKALCADIMYKDSEREKRWCSTRCICRAAKRVSTFYIMESYKRYKPIVFDIEAVIYIVDAIYTFGINFNLLANVFLHCTFLLECVIFRAEDNNNVLRSKKRFFFVFLYLIYLRSFSQLLL